MCQRTDNIKKIKELKNDNNEVKEENKETFIINIISKKINFIYKSKYKWNKRRKNAW